MGILDTISEALGGKKEIDVSRMDLPLSGDEAGTLNELISKGAYKDKTDFTKFLATSYVKNNLGAKMSGNQPPPESIIMDIIAGQGLNRSFSGDDIKTKLIPLFITGFMAIHRYMSSRKQEARAM